MPKARSLLKLVLCIFVACTICACSTNQDVEAGTPQLLASVSFDLYHNRIYLPVEVNERLVIPMVLDTGAADSGLSESATRALDLKTSGTAQLTGNGESNLRIGLTKNVEFRIGDATLLEKQVAIVPFQNLEASEGRVIAGVLGADLFRKYVVVIDYQNKKLSLFASKSFVYRSAGIVVPLRLKGPTLFQAMVLVADHAPILAELAIDSGTYSGLRLYPRFAEQHNFLTNFQLPSIPSFGFGIGGEFRERLTRITNLQIASLEIHEPVVSVSEATQGATALSKYDGTIGGAILRRFTVTLDYSRAQMILEGNSAFNVPFEADTSGLILSATGSDFKTISVHHVIPNTPAAAAGIEEGDILLAVNGAPAGSLGLEKIRLMLCHAGAYHLQLRRASNSIGIDVTTRDLVP